MKKIVFILIVILLTLVSCKKEQCNFPKSFICDIANDGIVKETEVDYWNGKSRINDAVDEHKTVKIDNSDISLVYDSSFTGNYWPCEVDRYYSSDDKYTVFFRTDNNQIAMYSLTSWTSYVDDFRIDPINNIEARVVADDIAKNYINIDEY
ncbi:MAG: hypothetical protein J5874_01205, partial [Oscillospiraceae bacterium]|nr:hypothetical protein [Oscillospiraceae bacterium]